MKRLHKLIKPIFSDLRSAVISVSLASLIAGGMVLFYLKKATLALKSIMQSATPLWATIALVFLVLVYTHIKNRERLCHSQSYIENDALSRAYRKSLSSLSVFVRISGDNSVPESDIVNLIKEIQYNTSYILSKNANNTMLEKSFNDFAFCQNKNTAIDLIDNISRIFKKKSDANKTKSKNKVCNANNHIITKSIDTLVVRIMIDSEFIKRQHINNGIIIKSMHEFKIPLKNITKSQREKLMNAFYPAFGTIPNYLYLPLYSSILRITKSGTRRHGLLCANFKDNNYWNAKLNPKLVTPKIIMKKWEIDFDKVNKTRA